MKPYYEDTKSGIVIYHGDCREIVPSLGKFDLLLTDPPYGIDAANNKRANLKRGKAATVSRDYGCSDWDKKPPSEKTIDLIRSVCAWQIIWGGNYFALPPRRGWLVWDKDNGKNGYADCELAWTNLELAVRKIKFRWMGMLQEKSGADKETRLHPTQKPVDVMTWAITLAGEGFNRTILDPFAGSGTTGRAAKDLGRACTMIEREEKYSEIAAKRMSQEVFNM